MMGIVTGAGAAGEGRAREEELCKTGWGTWMKRYVAALLVAGFSADAVGQIQNYPVPTPAMQKTIDTDNSRHFGSSPEEGGPLAKDLSPAMNAVAIDKALRKVADWQLATNQPYFDQIWTSAALYDGFLAAAKSTGDAKYRDAMMQVAEKYQWDERSHPAGADDEAIAQMYLELYLEQPKEKQDTHWIEPTQKNLDAVIGLKTLKEGDPRLAVVVVRCVVYGSAGVGADVRCNG